MHSTKASSTTDKLEAAIAEAVSQNQKEQAAQAAAAQAEERAAEKAEIEAFFACLPMTKDVLDILPPFKFKFANEGLRMTAWINYKDLVIQASYTPRINHKTCPQDGLRPRPRSCITWTLKALRSKVCVAEQILYDDPAFTKQPAADLGPDFLVFLHEAANTPTPEPEPPATGTLTDFRVARKRRERFIKAALQGTLMGLTNTGLEASACLQTALFAIETAEQVLALMEATPLQRKVLAVLSLEHFTSWLSSLSPMAVIGSLVDDGDHPVCNYIQHACGVSLNCSNLALTDESGFFVLGNDSTAPVPHELPLNIVGEWLPALLRWKTFDPDTQAFCPTFAAGEVLAFLKPFQR